MAWKMGWAASVPSCPAQRSREGAEVNTAGLMRISPLKVVLAGALVAAALALTVTLWVAAASADVNASDASGTSTLKFASDTTWKVFDADPSGPVNSLGFAQEVCPNASSPPHCPSGATLYGYAGRSWPADLSSIPGAAWIWAPGITGETSPAYPAKYFFSKKSNLPGTPTAGTISVAVDDFAQVLVNGEAVGTTGSLTDISSAGEAQSSLATFDITSYLVPGTNVITIRAANGPFGCGSGPYSCNPAGVVFGGSLSSEVAPPYAFSGFFSPVNNPPTLNVVKAGAAVPVKFSLGGNEGLNIFAQDYPKSRGIDCSSSGPRDALERTLSAGQSGLSYDPTTARYTYAWKTSKAWSGTCRQLVVKLDDGSVHRANFKFR
jgi:hypothetical protein